MAMMIRECMDDSFCTPTNDIKESLSVTEAAEGADYIDPDSLNVQIEAIHAEPFMTRNFTRYMKGCLKNSVPDWTSPYRRPLIKHHNEKNGEIIGRVLEAKYVTKDTMTGTPALMLTVNVPGSEKEDVKNGLLETTSIGAIAHDVRCSICGKQLANGEKCEHVKGVTYATPKGPQVMTWDIYDMTPKEVSFVVVPSDIYSKRVNYYPAVNSDDTPQAATEVAVTESYDETSEKGEPDMATENTNATELAEAKAKAAQLEVQLAEAKKAEAKVVELTESLTTSQAKVTELEGEVTKLTEAAKATETQMAEDKELRESLETSVADAKAQLKESLISNVQLLRESLGKAQLDAEKAAARSEDSLRDTICDLKEELTSKQAGVDVAESQETVEDENPDEKHEDEKAKKGADVKESVEEKLPAQGSLENPTLTDGVDVEESLKDSEVEIDIDAGMSALLGL